MRKGCDGEKEVEVEKHGENSGRLTLLPPDQRPTAKPKLVPKVQTYIIVIKKLGMILELN